MGNISESFETQIKLIDIWDSDRGTKWAESLYKEHMDREKAAPKAERIKVMLRNELLGANPYYVSSHVCELIEIAQETLPDIPLYAGLNPTTRGWVYLEKSFPLYPEDAEDNHNKYGNPPRLKAFTWHYQIKREVDNKKNTPELGFTFYEDSNPPMPISILNWDYGSNWGTDWNPYQRYSNPDSAVIDIRLEVMRRYVFTFLLFINQKIILNSKQPMNRSAIRRYKSKYYTEPPLIEVINLRKSAGSSRQNNNNREYSYQWLVNGHWRNQWYPSINVHNPKWIEPYIKGDFDKPFKKPSLRMFKVIR